MAVLPRNMLDNPYCATAATGWAAVGPAGYTAGARVTGLTLTEKATGWRSTKGTATSGEYFGASPWVTLTAADEGKAFAATVQFYSSVAISASTARIVMDFRDGSSTGLTELSVTMSALAANTARRLTVWGVAPKNARMVRVRVAHNVATTAALTLTAARIDAWIADTLPYADGATAGWAWTGTAGASTSVGPDSTPAAPTTNDALRKRVTDELKAWKTWLTENAARGYVGEFGGVTVWGYYNQAAEQTLWDDLLEVYLDQLDASEIAGTAWASGREWGAGYPLGIHVGPAVNDALSMTRSASGLLAGHPSRGQLPLGVNLSGAEQGVGISGGGTVRNSTTGYVHTQADFNYLYANGVRVVRLPVAWERIQPTLGSALVVGDLNNMISYAKIAGIRVIIDLHNYGRYTLANGTTVYQMGDANLTQALFNDLWTKMSANIEGSDVRRNTVIGYGLMNEPNALPGGAATWEAYSQAAVTAIRAANDQHTIYVGGYTFSSLFEWRTWHPDGWITDPANNFVYEAHHYWDTTSMLGSRSGTYQQNNGAGGQEIMKYATELAAANAAQNPTNLLKSDFTNGPNAEQFPTQFGFGVVNGRGRLTPTGGEGTYTAYKSANNRQLTEVFFEVTAVTAAKAPFPGANNAQNGNILSVVSAANPGVRFVIEHNPNTGTLTFGNHGSNNDNYYEAAGSPNVTYSPTTHRWWRIRRGNGNIYWETSADGVTYTIRRQIVQPTWSANDVQVSIESNRDDGPYGSYFEFDNINNVPAAVPSYATRFVGGLADGINENATWEWTGNVPTWVQGATNVFTAGTAIDTTALANKASNPYPGNTASTANQRCEIIPDGANPEYYSNNTRGYWGLAVRLGDSFPVYATSWQVITQWKNESTGSPPFEMKIGDGKLYLDGNSGAWKKEICSVYPGRTYKIVVDATLTESIATSRVSVWVNGIQYVTDSYPTGSAGFLYPGQRAYWKVGIYRDINILEEAKLLWGALAYDTTDRQLVQNYMDASVAPEGSLDRQIGAVSGGQVVGTMVSRKDGSIQRVPTGADPKRMVWTKTTSPARVDERATVPAIERGTKDRYLGNIPTRATAVGLLRGAKEWFISRGDQRSTLYELDASWSSELVRVVTGAVSYALGRSKTRGITATPTGATVQRMGAAKSSTVTLVPERSIQPLMGRSKSRTVGAIPTGATVATMARSKTRSFLDIGNGQSVYPVARAKSRTLGLITERSDLYRPSNVKADLLGRIDEVSAGWPVGASKSRTLGMVQEGTTLDRPYLGISTELGVVNERTTAGRLSWTKSRALGLVPGGQTVGSLLRSKTRTFAKVTTGQIVEWLLRSKTGRFIAISSNSTSVRFGWTKTRTVTPTAERSDSARISSSKTFTLTQIITRDDAKRMAGSKTRSLLDVGNGEMVGRFNRSKTRTLGVVQERATYAAPYLGVTTELGVVLEGSVSAGMAGSKSSGFGQIAENADMRLAVARSKTLGRIASGERMEIYFDSAFRMEAIRTEQIVAGEPFRSRFKSGSGNKASNEVRRKLRAYHV